MKWFNQMLLKMIDDNYQGEDKDLADTYAKIVIKGLLELFGSDIPLEVCLGVLQKLDGLASAQKKLSSNDFCVCLIGLSTAFSKSAYDLIPLTNSDFANLYNLKITKINRYERFSLNKIDYQVFVFPKTLMDLFEKYADKSSKRSFTSHLGCFRDKSSLTELYQYLRNPTNTPAGFFAPPKGEGKSSNNMTVPSTSKNIHRT